MVVKEEEEEEEEEEMRPLRRATGAASGCEMAGSVCRRPPTAVTKRPMAKRPTLLLLPLVLVLPIALAWMQVQINMH